MSRLGVIGGRVVTMGPRREVIDDGTILIEDRTIIAVGRRDQVEVPDGFEQIDATGCAVTPGFVNAHTHVPQILLRGGASSNRNYIDWRHTALWPGLAEFTAADIRCAYRLYCLEAIRAGVTTIVANDHVGPFDYLAAAAPAMEALDEYGMRAIYARLFVDVAPPEHDVLRKALLARRPSVPRVSLSRRTEAVLADLDRLIATYDGRSGGRIRVCPSPGSPTVVTLEALTAARQMAAGHGTVWATHVQETAASRPAPDISEIEYLDAYGLLDDRLLAGHCVHLDAKDIRLLRRNDVAVSTQPVSNGVLASGIAPIPALLASGVRVGLGTDDANCNDSIDPLADAKTLAIVQRALHHDVGVLTAAQVFAMITAAGAAAIGLGDTVGSLEAGKAADLCVIDLRCPQLVPAHDLVETLVWQAGSRAVRDVVIDGRVVMRDRRVAGCPDEAALLIEAQERSAALVHRAGLLG